MQRPLLVTNPLHQGGDLVGHEVVDPHGDPPPPARSTSAAVSSMVSGRSISDRPSAVDRPVQYTVAPAAPSATAIPRPDARVAPATSATLPSS